MAEKNRKFLVDALFEYDGCSCRAEKDIENVHPDEPPITKLKLTAVSSQPRHFSYEKKDGLNLTGPKGKVLSDNILGRLLSLKDGDADAHIEFFREYGFLFQISDKDYEAVDIETLMEFVRRIKVALRLMNSIALKKDYKQIMISVAYLLYARQVELVLQNETILTCPHTFTKLIRDYAGFPDLTQDKEAFDTGKITIEDSLYKPSYKLDVDFINAIRGGYETVLKGSADPEFRSLAAMYAGLPECDENLRIIIDFFFHYQLEYGVIKEVSYNRLSYYERRKKIDEDFSDEMKQALLIIARIVLSEEINYGIRNIHPRYNPEDLSVTWKLNNLYEALYFSIFYMRPGIQIYKECANPNCSHGGYFLVDATNQKKDYCCGRCRGNAATARYRATKKNGEKK